jgi:hypothetical protein
MVQIPDIEPEKRKLMEKQLPGPSAWKHNPELAFFTGSAIIGGPRTLTPVRGARLRRRWGQGQCPSRRGILTQSDTESIRAITTPAGRSGEVETCASLPVAHSVVRTRPRFSF